MILVVFHTAGINEKKKIFIMNNEKNKIKFCCRKSRTGLLPKCVVTHSVCCDLDVLWCWARKARRARRRGAGHAGRTLGAQAGRWARRRQARARRQQARVPGKARQARGRARGCAAGSGRCAGGSAGALQGARAAGARTVGSGVQGARGVRSRRAAGARPRRWARGLGARRAAWALGEWPGRWAYDLGARAGLR